MKYLLLLLLLLGHSFFAPAQLPVRDEPRHHNVFENQFIRILDVYLAPGDTTQYHLHNTPSIFITLANARVVSQLSGQPPQKGAGITGLTVYDEISTPRTHRVWNEDTSWFHVMDIELIAQQPKNDVQLLEAGDLKAFDADMITLFNQKLVTGYKLKFSAGQTMHIPVSPSGYLLISLANTSLDILVNGSVQLRNMKPGHYIWLDGKATTRITSKAVADHILLQLK